MNGRAGLRRLLLAAAGASAATSAGETHLQAQSLTGTTGLVTIPTASMPDDGALTVGMNLLDRRYDVPRKEHAALVQFASVGFLPFVEVDLRLTRSLGVPRQALGDRMVSVRVRLLKERARAPALVVGAQDLVGTRRHHAVYVVGSKAVRLAPLPGEVGVHLGYGGDWLRARGHEFVGVFGGLSVSPRPWLAVLLEHDAERLNAGLRLRPSKRVAILVAAHGARSFSGGFSYTHPLK